MPAENPRFFVVNTIGEPHSDNVESIKKNFQNLSITEVPDFYKGPVTSSCRAFTAICNEKTMKEFVREMDSRHQMANFGMLEEYQAEYTPQFLTDQQPIPPRREQR